MAPPKLNKESPPSMRSVAVRLLAAVVAVFVAAAAPAPVHAAIQTQTRTSAGTTTPGGTWTNSTNAATIDGACAQGDGVSATSMTITNWAFSIPAGSTILGITVRSVSAFNDVSTQDQIRLTKSGSAVGTAMILNGPGTDSSISCGDPIPDANGLTVGGADELWGTTWTVAEINDVGFGVFYDNDFSNTALDGVEITVTYDDGECEVTCSANVISTTDPNQCGAVVTFEAPTTAGDCGTVTVTPPSGSFFPAGDTTVMVTTTAGPSCSFVVTVNDLQAPVNTCAADVNVNSAVPAVATYAAPTVSDNCPGVVTLCAPASGSTFPVGSTTVTCTATDAATNATPCTLAVTVGAAVPVSPLWVTVAASVLLTLLAAAWLRRRARAPGEV